MLARDVTSSPSNASVSSARTSASCRARRRSGAMTGLEMSDQTLESQAIALGAEPRHESHRGVGQHRAMTLGLAPENVGQMDFHERDAHREQGVAHGKTRVRERGRVDHQAIGLALQPLDRVDEVAFMVGLDLKSTRLNSSHTVN